VKPAVVATEKPWDLLRHDALEHLTRHNREYHTYVSIEPRLELPGAVLVQRSEVGNYLDLE
jgi:hypothetical protein